MLFSIISHMKKASSYQKNDFLFYTFGQCDSLTETIDATYSLGTFKHEKAEEIQTTRQHHSQ